MWWVWKSFREEGETLRSRIRTDNARDNPNFPDRIGLLSIVLRVVNPPNTYTIWGLSIGITSEKGVVTCDGLTQSDAR